jgi:hypothetical protein
MNPISALSGIHWPSVLVASLASFAVGGLWYSRPLFGGMWASEIKMKKKKVKPSAMAAIFGTTFVLTLAGAIVLDLLIGPNGTLLAGLEGGLLVGVVFIGGSFGINYLFAGRSMRLYLIDAWYFAVLYLVMGAILGAW